MSRDPMRMNPLVIAIRTALGLLTWTAIGVQGVRHLAAGFPALNFVSYFTILSNAIAGVVLLYGAFLGATRREASPGYERARTAATLYMVMVGLVFVTLLRNVDLGGLLPWINTVHHYVMPLAVLLDWLTVPQTRSPSLRDVLVALGFPLAYLVYTLVRGAMIGWYPYPFVNPGIVGGYGAVALYVAGIMATFFAVGAAVRWVAALRAVKDYSAQGQTGR